MDMRPGWEFGTGAGSELGMDAGSGLGNVIS